MAKLRSIKQSLGEENEKRTQKISSLALGAILLASCRAKSNEDAKTESKSKEKLRIGMVQIADHPSLDAARVGSIEKLDEADLDYELIDHRANGDLALIPQSAADLKNKKADLIYTIGTPAAQGVANAINDLPILFSAVTTLL